MPTQKKRANFSHPFAFGCSARFWFRSETREIKAQKRGLLNCSLVLRRKVKEQKFEAKQTRNEAKKNEVKR
jgi:hypothetical protein